MMVGYLKFRWPLKEFFVLKMFGNTFRICSLVFEIFSKIVGLIFCTCFFQGPNNHTSEDDIIKRGVVLCQYLPFSSVVDKWERKRSVNMIIYQNGNVLKTTIHRIWHKKRHFRVKNTFETRCH